MQEGYVIPACDIIDDIRRSTKARELRLPTNNDVLCLASRYGNLNLVKSLLAAGVVVNDMSGYAKILSGALLEAAEHKQSDVMKVLLSAGANINEQGGQQYLPIHKLSADLEHTHLVEDKSCVAEDHPESSLSVDSRASPIGVQVRSHGYSTKPQLDTWAKTPDPSEEIALGRKTSRSFAKAIDVLERTARQIEKRD